MPFTPQQSGALIGRAGAVRFRASDAELIALTRSPPPKEPHRLLHPDQDCTGDMPALDLSPLRRLALELAHRLKPGFWILPGGRACLPDAPRGSLRKRVA
jgi:hypothetical protein